MSTCRWRWSGIERLRATSDSPAAWLYVQVLVPRAGTMQSECAAETLGERSFALFAVLHLNMMMITSHIRRSELLRLPCRYPYHRRPEDERHHRTDGRPRRARGPCDQKKGDRTLDQHVNVTRFIRGLDMQPVVTIVALRGNDAMREVRPRR